MKEQLEKILLKVLEGHNGVFLLNSRGVNNEFEFIIDGEQPLGIHNIADITSQFNKIADEQFPTESYTTEIASPGADSPITDIRQLPKHIGRKFAIELNTGEKYNNAKLIEVNQDELTFVYYAQSKPKPKDKELSLTLNFNQIKNIHIILSFK